MIRPDDLKDSIISLQNQLNNQEDVNLKYKQLEISIYDESKYYKSLLFFLSIFKIFSISLGVKSGKLMVRPIRRGKPGLL